MPNLRTCPCGNKFTPKNSLHKACCLEGSIEVAKTARKRHETKQAKVQRQEVRKAMDRLKSRSDWIKDAQVAWNRYVRMRDIGKPCISCGATPLQKYGGAMDCSHYRSVGAAPHLRFNLHNAAAACVKCNRHLAGNVVELRRGLVERIGIDKVQALEANNSYKKFDIEYLKRIKRIFSKKANILSCRMR